MKAFLFAISILACFGLKAQHIYPEKFNDCPNEEYAFERDAPNASINSIELLSFFKDNLDAELLQKLQGEVSLQIIVDMEGNSCLQSLENKTNIPTEQLNLKNAIDEKLVWGHPTEKVSVILIVTFDGVGFEIKRLGNDAVKGWHQLNF